MLNFSFNKTTKQSTEVCNPVLKGRGDIKGLCVKIPSSQYLEAELDDIMIFTMRPSIYNSVYTVVYSYISLGVSGHFRQCCKSSSLWIFI